MMFYAHIVLAISCITFILSFIVFINRIQTHHNLLQSDETIVIYNYDDSQIQPPSYDIINRNKNSDTSDEQTNEKLLREKVLGSNKTFNTILDRLTFINPPKLVCVYPKFTEHFMLILVLSRGLNFDYRQAIRATWGRNGKFKKSNISVKTIFFVGTDDTVQSAIRNEQAIFNDVIEIGIPENYPFVAHKELASLLWTRLYCPLARMIFRADDDIFLDTALLLNYIQSNINLDINDGLYGWFRFNNSVHRADKWAVTKLEYESKIYPPYTFGIGYLFSNISCQRLINAANQPDHEIIRIGDVYITGILRDMAQISYYDFRDLDYAYTFYEAIPCDEYFEKRPQLLICMSKLHIGLRGDPYEFYDVWDIIVARHNKSLLDTNPIGIFDVYKSAYLLSNETLLLNIHNHLTHHIYIDVGCFNGETIEHFIHFTPNSSFYDIITFEPDPINYQLCKQRLTQKKYSNYNIIIIPKVVWIRDEKVSYQTDCGQKCRIDSNKTSLTELDAIDFSSWLSHLIKTNNTKLHIKLSMPGAEVLLLRKMLVDGTFELADQWAVEWSDKSNLRTQPARVYVQLMFDTLGYDFRYFTSLPDVRRMFNINGSFDSITNHNWTSMTQPEVYYHYIQRPDLANIPPKNRTKLQKF